MTKTIFEKIILREIPANIHYEDDDLIIIDDVNPVAPIHLLIIPKNKIETLNDLNDKDTELIGKMFQAAKKMANKLDIDKSGYRTIFNCNEDGGQTVYHIHLHLIGGRSLVWPPG
ncbi:MAG: histidine triad nucleotide-binding protein [Candidatus Marinimicrobia bacterium]|mgnify:CR=1 FL=1|nr:histidine triad nucleotide-binding protein [Candidatus Neomarinimicrobiota bacterium]|tara:strand:+ start:6588 stop:6932 length:345 start_codon:yes stop_codon:yes gene_type:complete